MTFIEMNKFINFSFNTNRNLITTILKGHAVFFYYFEFLIKQI